MQMEEEILKGVCSILPEVQYLYCVHHLMQRDEQKINSLLQNVAKKEIVSDTYSKRRGGLYECGYSECWDAEEF